MLSSRLYAASRLRVAWASWPSDWRRVGDRPFARLDTFGLACNLLSMVPPSPPNGVVQRGRGTTSDARNTSVRDEMAASGSYQEVIRLG